MSEPDNKLTAQSLISTYGLRAQAVVSERIDEARLQGNPGELSRWRNVELAIQELRRTAPA